MRFEKLGWFKAPKSAQYFLRPRRQLKYTRVLIKIKIHVIFPKIFRLYVNAGKEVPGRFCFKFDRWISKF